MSKNKGKTKEEPRVVVREVGGQLVLDDPDAAAVIRIVEKSNCINTLELNADRVVHFVQRMKEKNLTAAEAVIVVINVDDVHGGPLADMLMPNHNWQEIRDKGEVPFARGLAMREGIQEYLEPFDNWAARKLEIMMDIAVVVVDHGFAEVFPAVLVTGKSDEEKKLDKALSEVKFVPETLEQLQESLGQEVEIIKIHGQEMRIPFKEGSDFPYEFEGLEMKKFLTKEGVVAVVNSFISYQTNEEKWFYGFPVKLKS